MTYLRDTWQTRVARSAAQHPLVETRTSLEGLRRTGLTRRPNAVFLGIGLCSPQQLSQAVPVDLLGMLLPAEEVRRAAGAEQLVVLIADRHALTNGFTPTAVDHRAQAVERVLARLRRRSGFQRLVVRRASSFHDDLAYRAILAEIRAAAPRARHEYVNRQLADVIYLDRTLGGILKVGWVIGRGRGRRERDELAFDRALRAHDGGRIGFVYCQAGRALCDRAPRVPPYIATRPAARVCMSPDESPAAKLAPRRGTSAETVNGYRRYLKAITYSYVRQAEPLPRGSLEDRLGVLISRLAEAPPVALPKAG